MIGRLLGDIGRHYGSKIRVILTENVPDSVPISTEKLPFPVEKIVNASPKGFGANHNAAFTRCHTPLFCVVNPDVRLESDPLASLSRTLEDRRVGVAGPLVRNPNGKLEDSARKFPTRTSLLLRAFENHGGAAYPVDQGPLPVDWVAGMFMLFRRETYEALGGFDEAYFLYYEDVDICWRLRAKGYSVVYDPRAEIIHDARRASRGNLRLAAHHLASIFRYLRRTGG
jgi:GT2 family glycosyltransferase